PIYSGVEIEVLGDILPALQLLIEIFDGDPSAEPDRDRAAGNVQAGKLPVVLAHEIDVRQIDHVAHEVAAIAGGRAEGGIVKAVLAAAPQQGKRLDVRGGDNLPEGADLGPGIQTVGEGAVPGLAEARKQGHGRHFKQEEPAIAEIPGEIEIAGRGMESGGDRKSVV